MLNSHKELSTDLTLISFFVLALRSKKVFIKSTLQAFIFSIFFLHADWSAAQSSNDLNNKAQEPDRLEVLIPLDSKSPASDETYLQVITSSHESSDQVVQQIKTAQSSSLLKSPQIISVGIDDQTLEQVQEHFGADTRKVLKISEADAAKMQSSNHSEASAKLRWTLTILRFIANGSITTASLIITQDVSISKALFIGVMAGGATAALQYHTQVFANWLKNSYKMISVAEKMKLIKAGSSKDADHLIRKILSETEKYIKWGLLEVAFVKMIDLSMMVVGIPTSDVFWNTVLKSTASQGIFDVGVSNLSQQLAKKYPHLKQHIDNGEHIGMFTSSIISVFSAVGALIDLPLSDVGFAALAGGGIILNTYPSYQAFKIKRQCRALFVN